MVLDVTRCGIKIDPRSFCQRPRHPDAPFNICTQHLLGLADWVVESGWAEKLDARPPLAAVGAQVNQLAPKHHRPLVYYISWADRIKIGTTRRLVGRMNDLPHDALLALEPGGVEVESRRHVQFAECRTRGEWFDGDNQALRDHIAGVCDAHGGPAAMYAALPALGGMLPVADRLRLAGAPESMIP